MKLFTVGPVEMYNDLLSGCNEQIPYFRNEWFSNIMFELDANIKAVANMSENDKNLVLTCSGTGAMEAVVMNCLSENDKVLIIVGGTFGQRFEALCKIHNIAYDVIKVENAQPFDSECLKMYESKGYTALLVNIDETSVGQLYPIDILSEFCVRNNMLFIVDAISSLFADEIDFTENKIDALIFSSQKALALAPGVSVVSLSERICKEHIVGNAKTMYFDFSSYLTNGLRGQTPFTPAIGIIVQMNEMIGRIKEMGIEQKIAMTRNLAEDFRDKAVAASFKVPQYPLSNALTPILFKSRAMLYYEKLIEGFGITVNPCGGENADKMLRVGHMGNLTVEDNDMLIKALCEIRSKLDNGKFD